MKDILRVEADESPVQEISTAGFLMASSLHLASADGGKEDGRWSLWARGSRSSFSGREDALTLEGRDMGSALDGRAVSVGVRPENVQLVGSGGVSVGTVNLIEPLGDETLVFIDYGGDETLITKVEASHGARPGDRVNIDFKRGGVLLFDGDTEERIVL